MRLPLLFLALPALALAAEPAQRPLADQVYSWWSKAKSYIPVHPIVAPLDAGAARAASQKLIELTTSNWETVMAPSYHTKTGTFGPDTWMVLVTGGNRTCGGLCRPMEAEFNKSIAILSADKKSPRFGILDCDRYAVLCSTWLAGPPTLWYIQRPEQVVDGKPANKKETPIYVVRLNATETSAKDLVAIHKEKKYNNWKRMDSMFHPFDGKLAELGMQKPLGYALFLFSMIPSWGLMLAVSFMTRQFMNNRAGNPAAAERARAFQNRPLGGAPAADGR